MMTFGEADAVELRNLREKDISIESAEEASESQFSYAYGWNRELLYKEILHEISITVGHDGAAVDEKNLFSYIQNAFKISDGAHAESLHHLREQGPPVIQLDVEVVGAKELVQVDQKQLSDSFVTMYIASNPQLRFSTTIKSNDMNPIWEEHFSFPLLASHKDEDLVVEIWDFNLMKPVKTIMNRVFSFQSVRILKHFVKLFASITRKELVGSVVIPLKTIPVAGLDSWHNLNGETDRLLNLRLNFSAEKNRKVSNEEYRRLLRIILRHELESSQIAHYRWSGKFSCQADAILGKYAGRCGLANIGLDLVQWAVYTSVHIDHPLSYRLFDKILTRIVASIENKSISSEDLKIFWGTTTQFLSSCFLEIKRLKEMIQLDVETLTAVLNVISKIASLEPPDVIDPFLARDYVWIQIASMEPVNDIDPLLEDYVWIQVTSLEPSEELELCPQQIDENDVKGIQDRLLITVIESAEEWFQCLSDIDHNASAEDKINTLIRIAERVHKDVLECRNLDELFEEKVNLPYSKTMYTVYRRQIVEMFGSIIVETCRNMPSLNLSSNLSLKLMENKNVDAGTSLFKLYLILKNFFEMKSIWMTVVEDDSFDEYHSWFNGGIDSWVELSTYKAFISIQKAINLDNMAPITEYVKFSSSAVNVLGILNQIKIFWEQLSWPNIDGNCNVARKVAELINKCCEFYIIHLSQLIDAPSSKDSLFEVTRRLCVVINDIDHLNEHLPIFSANFKFTDAKIHKQARQCTEVMQIVIDAKVEEHKARNVKILEDVVKRMQPTIQKLLLNGSMNFQDNQNAMSGFFNYLANSLETLETNLEAEYRVRIFYLIWTEIISIMNELVRLKESKKKTPAYYNNLLKTLWKIQKSFQLTEKQAEELKYFEKMLQLRGCETFGVIHEYYKSRLIAQNKISEAPFGVLTVQCCFKEYSLEIKILNARNLQPRDLKETCNSYVRINLSPNEKFSDVAKRKTKTFKKSVFPLYDEKFTIPLNREQRYMSDAIIVFSVKDKNIFGFANQHLSECYLSFEDIEDIENPPQLHLKLSKHNDTYTSAGDDESFSSLDYITALEERQNDKDAKDFVRKIT